MARPPRRHPPAPCYGTGSIPSPAVLSLLSLPSGLHSTFPALLARDTCVLGWGAAGTSLGQGGVRRGDRSQQLPLGQGRCAGEDKRTWEQSLPSPVPKASTGIAPWAERFFHFLLQSAAGFDEMAAPTSSYEKTRPLEAGES